MSSCIFGDRKKKDSASLDRAHRVRPFWLVVCPSRAPASPPRPLLLPHMWGLRCFIACKVQGVKWPKLGWARVNCLGVEPPSGLMSVEMREHHDHDDDYHDHRHYHDHHHDSLGAAYGPIIGSLSLSS